MKGHNELITVESEIRIELIQRSKIAFFHMGAPLVMSFFAIDWLLTGKFDSNLFFLRLTVFPVAFFLWCSYRVQNIREKYPASPALCFVFFLGALNVIFIEKVSGLFGLYFGGLNLVCIGLAFLNIGIRAYLIGSVLIFGPHIIRVLWVGYPISPEMISCYTFMLATIFLGVLNVYQFGIANKNLVIYKRKNSELLSQREAEIEKAVNHARVNEGFAAQFSPQVRIALSEKKINFDTLRGYFIAFLMIDVADCFCSSEFDRPICLSGSPAKILYRLSAYIAQE